MVTYLAVIIIGLSVCFVAVRLSPADPILQIISRFAALGQVYDPATCEDLINTLRDVFGFQGSLLEQYASFLRRSFTLDFGPSISVFPTPVNQIVFNSLPWTIGLLIITTILSWIVGNFIGAIAGYYSEKKWVKALTGVAIVLYPIPYYIMALILILVFIYILPVFPIIGGVTPGLKPSLSLEYIFDLLRHAFLPGLSLVLVGYGFWFLSMRSIVTHVKSEDFVTFGKIAGLPERKIMLRYVFRNSLLPQVTGLSMSLGAIFSGAMATEVVFGYPGVGTLLFRSIADADFNLMMGIVTFSIIGVSTAVLILDLLYPLIDPRIRYR